MTIKHFSHNFGRLAFVIGSILFASSFVIAQQAQAARNDAALGRLIKLEGKVNKVQLLSQDSNSVRVKISFELALKNDSDSSAILYTSDLDLDIVSLELFKSDVGSESKTVFYHGSGLRSNIIIPDLADFQQRMLLSTPSSDIATIIPPKSSVSIPRETEVEFYKKRMVGLSDETWEDVLKASPLSMKVKIELFPEYLDTRFGRNKSFSEQLKNKWTPYGELQLGYLESRPISIDLSEATPKRPVITDASISNLINH